jgi:tRNA A-37 threonylcarbamoyl transferase component Bud32
LETDGVTGLVQVYRGGLRWNLVPELVERVLSPSGLRLGEWLERGLAKPVKHGPHRSVYQVVLPGCEFHLKHYRLMDARSWWRQLVRPPKARIEYERTVAVAARNVPTAMPLGLGEPEAVVRPGESYLLMRSLPAVQSLRQFIEHALPLMPRAQREPLRPELARKLGSFMARIHQGGVLHRDLHAGNVLVRAGEAIELYLIDLHDVRLGRPLGWRASRENLAVFNRWFSLQVSRTDRRRFWHAYLAAREWGEAAEDRGRQIERRTWASNLTFWAHRDERCLVTNRYYQRLRSPLARGYAVRDLDRTLLQELLADPDAPFARDDARWLKKSNSSSVIEIDMPTDGTMKRIVYKRFRVVARSDPWVAIVRRSPALRCWVYGHGLRERSIPTPRPLAMFHRVHRGLPYEGYLLMEKVERALDLHGRMSQLESLPEAEGNRSRRRLIEQTAHLIRELHDRQLSHRDLKASNLLVQDDDLGGGMYFIDLVGVRRHRLLSLGRRAQNLGRLHASFCRSKLLTRTDKLRFLRVYLRWGLEGAVGWKEWWRTIDEATRAKIARNRRSGRLLT